MSVLDEKEELMTCEAKVVVTALAFFIEVAISSNFSSELYATKIRKIKIKKS
ncbi:hypothetical protein [Lutimonas vermicola]|uniref:Uncharacterized protein n=1 Tax=Lutimonas vermicola TaxID=414288 RepID=A0ABU9L448_9FLAO